MTTNNGIERGKFRSLTLINWNGFARTFDLDELVTTLSGGNGAEINHNGWICDRINSRFNPFTFP